MLERVRAHLGMPVIVTSGYRSRAVNAAVGGVTSSDHAIGAAADIVAPKFGAPYAVAKALAPHVNALGVGQIIYESAGGKHWVHLSARLPDRPVNRVITVSGKSTLAGIQEVYMLALLKSRAWQLLALVLAALLLWQSLARQVDRVAAFRPHADLAMERAAAAAATAETSECYRKLGGTYREKLDFITREAHQAQARVAADADAARATAGRLRGDLSDYITAHRAAAKARSVAGQCTPDTGALDLLADLQRRADERAGELARIADDARGRGSACEQSYNVGRAMIKAAQ